MKVLCVGDVHATPEDLEDCVNLRTYILDVAERESVDVVLFLGDQYNCHNVMRVEVLGFWYETFELLKHGGVDTWALIGNHDYAGEGSVFHAMMAHDNVISVIDSPRLENGILLMPYFSDTEKMVHLANDSYNGFHAKTLICHQTFEGSKYENGLYAPDGLDPDRFPQENIISGHIHTPQSFGKVTYIGAPRWRSLSDANIDRAIVVYEFGPDGSILSTKPYSTGGACKQIKYIEITPDMQAFELDPAHDWRVDIRGPKDWVEQCRSEMAGMGHKIRTFPTTSAAPKVRESAGIDVAFNGYLKSYVGKYGTPLEKLAEMAKERLHV